VRDDTAFVFTALLLCNFDSIADDVDWDVCEGGLTEDAFDGHVDDVCCGVGLDGGCGDDDEKIFRVYFFKVNHYVELFYIKERNYTKVDA
jgi:hypothetical protein